VKLSDLVKIDDAADEVTIAGARVAGDVFRVFATPSHPGYWYRTVSVDDTIVIQSKTDDELTLAAFRRANVARCIKWHPAGIAGWSPSDWLTAVTGELGELASLLKMRNRERDGLPGNKFSPTDKQIADELADVFTYLDLLAEVLGVDLGAAAVSKFNEVSRRVGFPDRIDVAS
jgi:NTP pyrophosphatase (non-canonical NTP hydrolase)